MTLSAFLYSLDKNSVGLYQEGRKAQIKEDYYRAIELYKASIKDNPDNYKPIKGLAECFHAIGENSEALKQVSMAKKYNKVELELYTLEGMIQIALGNLDFAKEQFNYVLEKEPHNIEARFGLAELDIANGKRREAAKKYLETLNFMPKNKVALLKLSEIFEDLGNDETAQIYLEMAIKYHSVDPKVHYAIGKYYLTKNNIKMSEYHLKTAISLKENFFDAKQLLSIIYFNNEKVSDAINLMRETLSSKSSDLRHFAYYCLGLFYSKNDMIEEAIQNFNLSLQIKYDDEVSRIAAENIAIEKMEVNQKTRGDLSDFHYREGKLLEEQNYLSKALIEYRRALRLYYDFNEARFKYAGIYKKLGFPLRYLVELEVLKDIYKSNSKEVLDEIDLHLLKAYQSVTYKWLPELKAITLADISNYSSDETDKKIFDQYSIRQKYFTIALFTNPTNNIVIHPYADRILTEYLHHLLLRYRNIKPLSDDIVISGFNEAFRKANEADSDYFILLEYTENERSFHVTCRIYLTRTGSELSHFNIFKTGNRRVHYTFVKLSDSIFYSLPVRGTLLARKYNKGLIDLGSYHGIDENDELIIIKKGMIELDHSKIGLLYRDKDVIGKFKVTQTDENLSEGLIQKKNFFDFINPEDELVIDIPKENNK